MNDDPNPRTRETTPETRGDEDNRLDEIESLFRRLHVALEEPGRSELLVELMRDDRVPLVLLGFELASRDLSSGSTLGSGIADEGVELIEHPDPKVRDQAVRLVTRLSLPDSMQILARALESEDDAAVASSILSGLRRWPTPIASRNILRWFTTSSDARAAASGAAWALEEIDGWANETDRSEIAERVRAISDETLTPSDLNLIATMGTREDLERLVLLLGRPGERRLDAARALALTPFGLDPLIDAATQDPAVAPFTSAAIRRHQADSQGFSTLASLRFEDQALRRAEIKELSSRLEPGERAGGIVSAIKSGAINPTLGIELLRNLLSVPQSSDPRVPEALLMLARFELDALRPDRALDALDAARLHTQDSPGDGERSVRAQALILSGSFGSDQVQGASVDDWIAAFGRAVDEARRSSIASEILRRGVGLPESIRGEIESAAAFAPDPSEAADETTQEQP